MTREAKNRVVTALAKRLSATSYFYIIDAEGLDMEAINDFRRKCFQAGVYYQVVKNTLMKKALESLQNEVDYTAFGEKVLEGFSGVLFTNDLGRVPARIIKDFRKQTRLTRPILKGASIDNALFVGEEHLELLSKLKSKNELIGELMGLLQSPFTRVINALQSGKVQLAGVVKALAEKKA